MPKQQKDAGVGLDPNIFESTPQTEDAKMVEKLLMERVPSWDVDWKSLLL